MRRVTENRRQKTQLQNYIIIAWKRPLATATAALTASLLKATSLAFEVRLFLGWKMRPTRKNLSFCFFRLQLPRMEAATRPWLRPLTKDVMVFVECLPKYYCITTIYYLVPIRPTDRPQAQTASDNWLSELYFAYFAGWFFVHNVEI